YAADNLRSRGALVGGGELEIDAVDLIFHVAAAVFEAQYRCIERRVNKVIQILAGNAFDRSARTELRANKADDMKPLFVHLYIFANGLFLSEQCGPGSLAQHSNRRSVIVLIGIEELPGTHTQVSDPLVVGIDSIN